MKLSIVISFCDKDFCYLEDLLKSIKEKVLINYEIAIMDNRDDKSLKLPDESLYDIYVSNEKNEYNFSRKKMINYINGDRVWFIDCDDEIFGVDGNYDKYNEDVLYFRNTFVKTKENYGLAREPLALWNKWFKVESLKYINNFFDTDLIGLDDWLIQANIDKMSVRELDNPIYIYNKYRSSSFNSIYGDCMSKEAFQRMFMAKENYLKELQAIGREDLYKTFIQHVKNTVFFVKDEKKEETFKWIEETFIAPSGQN